MIDYILILIIIALGVFIYFKDKEHNAQVNKLIQAIVAKNSQELRDLKVADNTKIKINPTQQMAQETGLINDQPEYISLNNATDDQFMNAIKHELEPNPEAQEEESNFFE